MNMFIKRLLLLFILIFHFSCYKNEIKSGVIYHEYTPTASDWDILKWKTTDTTQKYILKEIIDSLGRVIELQFLKDGKINEDCLCYLSNKVVFIYTDSTITENLYWNNEPITADECDMPFKTIYYIDNNKYIKFAEEFTMFSGKEEKKIILPDSSQLEVSYFLYSFAKMNGFYPVSRNYKLVEQDYFGSEPERTELKNRLRK